MTRRARARDRRGRPAALGNEVRWDGRPRRAAPDLRRRSSRSSRCGSTWSRTRTCASRACRPVPAAPRSLRATHPRRQPGEPDRPWRARHRVRSRPRPRPRLTPRGGCRPGAAATRGCGGPRRAKRPRSGSAPPGPRAPRPRAPVSRARGGGSAARSRRRPAPARRRPRSAPAARRSAASASPTGPAPGGSASFGWSASAPASTPRWYSSRPGSQSRPRNAHSARSFPSGSSTRSS